MKLTPACIKASHKTLIKLTQSRNESERIALIFFLISRMPNRLHVHLRAGVRHGRQDVLQRVPPQVRLMPNHEGGSGNDVIKYVFK